MGNALSVVFGYGVAIDWDEYPLPWEGTEYEPWEWWVRYSGYEGDDSYESQRAWLKDHPIPFSDFPCGTWDDRTTLLLLPGSVRRAFGSDVVQIHPDTLNTMIPELLKFGRFLIDINIDKPTSWIAGSFWG